MLEDFKFLVSVPFSSKQVSLEEDVLRIDLGTRMIVDELALLGNEVITHDYPIRRLTWMPLNLLIAPRVSPELRQSEKATVKVEQSLII